MIDGVNRRMRMYTLHAKLYIYSYIDRCVIKNYKMILPKLFINYIYECFPIETVRKMPGNPLFIAIQKVSMHLPQSYMKMKPTNYPVCYIVLFILFVIICCK